jgi:hypothetical protein
MRRALILLIVLLSFSILKADFVIVRLKYRGGGDWYNDPSIIPNLAKEINARTAVHVQQEEVSLSLSGEEIFRYPFLFMTGHGNIEERECLREYLMNGGFLYADDDYGMDEAFRREIKSTFPEKDLIEIPFEHDLYRCFYELEGLPKIHKHDDKPPKGFGIFEGERMILFYTYESNISDGWADPEVHRDPAGAREEAFQMGVNIFIYAITH